MSVKDRRTDNGRPWVIHMTRPGEARRFKKLSIAVSLTAALILAGAGLISCASDRGDGSQDDAQSMPVESGSPLDADLKVGGDTPITKMGTLEDGAVLSIHADGPRSLATYFGAGGEGNDLTVHIQTTDAKVQFPVAGNIATLGDDFINFKVPSSGQAVLRGISGGDRFIFALIRPSSPDPTW